MIKNLLVVCFLFLIACNNNSKSKHKNIKPDFIFRALTKNEKALYKGKAAILYHNILNSNFSGGILVAKNGEIIFEQYNGFSNFSAQEKITENTPIHIASASKPLTALAILKLFEENKLQLTDSIQHFFPNFPYHGVTIFQLLSHRSGLPNYLYFMDTAWNKNLKATNIDVLNFMIEKQPEAYAIPDKVFHYCNTNYVLLALIVEKLTQQAFPDYMKEKIFTPLAMKDTYIFSIKDTSNYTPSYSYNDKPFALEPFDCIYGDKNVYSTVRDLLKLDNALYQHTIISATTTQKAFTGYSNEKKGFKNYGLGFRLFIDNAYTVVYHGGWWHGNNALFTRLLKDTATIITLGNKYNRSIYNTKQLATIFSNNADKDLSD